MEKILHLKNWIFRLYRWVIQSLILLWRLKVILVSIGYLFPLAVIIPSIIFNHEEGIFVVFGLFLELAGLFTVFLGIRDTTKLFQKGNRFAEAATQILSSYPAFQQRSINGSTTVHLEPIGLTAHASVSDVKLRQITSVEDRVNHLEEKMGELSQKLDQLTATQTREQKALTAKISDESKTRSKEDIKIKDLIEKSSAGGLSVELLGAWWIGFGMTYSTIPNFMCKLFAFIFIS